MPILQTSNAAHWASSIRFGLQAVRILQPTVLEIVLHWSAAPPS